MSAAACFTARRQCLQRFQQPALLPCDQPQLHLPVFCNLQNLLCPHLQSWVLHVVLLPVLFGGSWQAPAHSSPVHSTAASGQGFHPQQQVRIIKPGIFF